LKIAITNESPIFIASSKIKKINQEKTNPVNKKYHQKSNKQLVSELKISTTKKKSIAYTLNKPKNQQINN
jgi:hypothetical protein